MVEKYRCESFIHFGINLLLGSNMIKKNSLVWKHCVQVQNLTSLCKNSTSYLHVIFYRPCFKSCIKVVYFFAGGPIFPDNHTPFVLFLFFSIFPRYYDKNGKKKRKLSSKRNGRLKKLKILYGGDISDPLCFM